MLAGANCGHCLDQFRDATGMGMSRAPRMKIQWKGHVKLYLVLLSRTFSSASAPALRPFHRFSLSPVVLTDSLRLLTIIINSSVPCPSSSSPLLKVWCAQIRNWMYRVKGGKLKNLLKRLLWIYLRRQVERWVNGHIHLHVISFHASQWLAYESLITERGRRRRGKNMFPWEQEK